MGATRPERIVTYHRPFLMAVERLHGSPRPQRSSRTSPDSGQPTSQPLRTNTKIKFVEIRDESTFIPAMAICLWPAGDGLVQAQAYSLEDPSIMLTRLTGGECQYAPYKWPNRTPRLLPLSAWWR